MQYILDTVVQALAANPDRKFIYSEMVGGEVGRHESRGRGWVKTASTAARRCG